MTSINFNELASKSIPKSIIMPTPAQDAKYIFSVTYTDPEAMELDDLAYSASNIIPKEGRDLATYPPTLGHEGLREFIANDLKANRGNIKLNQENIFLSSGAGGSIETLVDAFIDDGDVVMMEEFSYHGSLNMFLRKGAKPVHVKMDENGMDTQALEDEITKKINAGVKPKFIYTIPVYHNPTGVTLSQSRREEMIEISNKYNIPIIENESYADFLIDGEKLPPAMIGMDGGDNVFYISAYTKLLGCALRLGFTMFPEEARETLSRVGFGTSPSHLTSMVVNEYLRENKNRYVQSVAKSLENKRDAMLRSLETYFPSTCKWSAPSGGMIIWVELPKGCNTWDVYDKALARGVSYNPGQIFRADRAGENFLRLTYTHNSTEEITEGISILSEVFNEEGFFES